MIIIIIMMMMMMMMTIIMIIIFHMESRAKVVTKFGVNVFA